ncbi:MAG: glycosyltransferase family 39 protein [Candidatus Handelsmanbacteria bacterium]|nr:glycosyltransferase family 39 protein [Candidatus Handelsmanbacteria bacterium]
MKPARWFWTWMAAVALAALGLRLFHLTPEEFVEGDDATYYLTARSLSVMLGWGWENALALVAGQADPGKLAAAFAAEGVEMRFPYYSKPVYDFLSVGALALFGPRPDAMLWMNTLFGVTGVVLIGLLGRHLFGETAGVVAAALLSVSGSALIYSRSGLANMASIALALAGVLLYCRAQSASRAGKGELGVAGVLGGLALATHPNLLPFLALLAAQEGLFRLRGGERADLALRLGWVGGGAVAALGGIQLIYLGAQHLFGGVLAALPPSPAPFMTYSEQLAAHTRAVIDGQVPLAEKLYTYILVFWAHEGAPVFALVLAATGAFLASPSRRSGGLLALLVLFWVPLVFFILSRNQAVYRYAAGLVVPALLLAAWGLDRVSAWLADRSGVSRQAALSVGGLLLVGYNLVQVLPVYTANSAWASGSRWLHERGQGAVLSSAGMQLWRLSRIAVVTPTPEAQSQTPYWALYRRYLKAEEQELLRRVEAKGLAPVFRSEHRRPTKQLEVQWVRDSWLLSGLAALPGLGGRISAMREEVLRRNRLCAIEIYDLRQADLNDGSAPSAIQRGVFPFTAARSQWYAERF